jgi:hypothetical protein
MINPKKLLAVCLVASQLTLPMIAYADPNVPVVVAPTAEADVGSAISPMKKGQAAPFTGVLFSPKASATIITQLANLDAQIKIETDKVLSDAKAQCTYQVSETRNVLETDKKIIQANLDTQKLQVNMLTVALKKAEADRPNLPLWISLGFGGGVAITVLTAFAVVKTTK